MTWKRVEFRGILMRHNRAGCGGCRYNSPAHLGDGAGAGAIAAVVDQVDVDSHSTATSLVLKKRNIYMHTKVGKANLVNSSIVVAP